MEVGFGKNEVLSPYQRTCTITELPHNVEDNIHNHNMILDGKSDWKLTNIDENIHYQI